MRKGKAALADWMTGGRRWEAGKQPHNLQRGLELNRLGKEKPESEEGSKKLGKQCFVSFTLPGSKETETRFEFANKVNSGCF